MLHFNTIYIYSNKLFIENAFYFNWYCGGKVGSVLILFIVYNPANYYYC